MQREKRCGEGREEEDREKEGGERKRTISGYVKHYLRLAVGLRVVSLARSAPLKSRAAPFPFLRAPAVN